jgi:integrase/recombinase XerD
MAERQELERLLEPWTRTLRVRSEATARNYRRAVEQFLAFLPEDGDYLEAIEDLAKGSQAFYVSAVRTFLKFGQAQGVVERSPVELLVRPKVSVTSFGRYLDLDELRKLVTAARELSPRHLACVLVLADTGLRISELASASWRDLYRDPQGRLGLRVLGKGGKERVVRVRDDVFAALTALHGSERLDAKDTSPLLPDSRRTAYSTRGLYKLVVESAQVAELDKPVSPHWLRHSHATLAALGGASAFAIQASLGHSRLETSQRYIHWARGLDDTTADALPPLS